MSEELKPAGFPFEAYALLCDAVREGWENGEGESIGQQCSDAISFVARQNATITRLREAMQEAADMIEIEDRPAKVRDVLLEALKEE